MEEDTSQHKQSPADTGNIEHSIAHQDNDFEVNQSPIEEESLQISSSTANDASPSLASSPNMSDSIFRNFLKYRTQTRLFTELLQRVDQRLETRIQNAHQLLQTEFERKKQELLEIKRQFVDSLHLKQEIREFREFYEGSENKNYGIFALKRPDTANPVFLNPNLTTKLSGIQVYVQGGHIELSGSGANPGGQRGNQFPESVSPNIFVGTGIDPYLERRQRILLKRDPTIKHFRDHVELGLPPLRLVFDFGDSRIHPTDVDLRWSFFKGERRGLYSTISEIQASQDGVTWTTLYTITQNHLRLYENQPIYKLSFDLAEPVAVQYHLPGGKGIHTIPIGSPPPPSTNNTTRHKATDRTPIQDPKPWYRYLCFYSAPETVNMATLNTISSNLRLYVPLCGVEVYGSYFNEQQRRLLANVERELEVFFQLYIDTKDYSVPKDPTSTLLAMLTNAFREFTIEANYFLERSRGTGGGVVYLPPSTDPPATKNRGNSPSKRVGFSLPETDTGSTPISLLIPTGARATDKQLDQRRSLQNNNDSTGARAAVGPSGAGDFTDTAHSFFGVKNPALRKEQSHDHQRTITIEQDLKRMQSLRNFVNTMNTIVRPGMRENSDEARSIQEKTSSSSKTQRITSDSKARSTDGPPKQPNITFRTVHVPTLDELEEGTTAPVKEPKRRSRKNPEEGDRLRTAMRHEETQAVHKQFPADAGNVVPPRSTKKTEKPKEADEEGSADIRKLFEEQVKGRHSGSKDGDTRKRGKARIDL